MTQSITPKQALFLWHLILTDGAKDVGVMASKTVPRLSPTEWKSLVKAGYLDSGPRGGATFLAANEQTWSWAEQAERVELARLASPSGAAALEALLNRLLPLLRERDIGLAELFKNDPPAPTSPPATNTKRKKAPAKKKKAPAKKAPAKKKKAPAKKATTKKKPRPAATKATRSKATSTRFVEEPVTTPASLSDRIEQACLSLTHGARQTRVKLYDLRSNLADVTREDLDRALLTLQRERKLVLYREDNSAALLSQDHDAALFVGNEPRHLVLLET